MRCSQSRSIPRWLAAGLLGGLVACGGGSSGGDAPAPPAPAPPAPAPPAPAPPAPAPPVSGTPPSVRLDAPAALADGLAGTVTLAASASDDTGVAGVQFQVDGAAVAPEDTTAPYAVNVDTAAYPAGQHVVRARARDVAGNVSAWSSAIVRFAGTRAVPAGFTMTPAWVAGLALPTAFAEAPDGRLFVCEQGGALRVVKNGALLAAPFHAFAVDATGERGLLGVAIDPAFASNGFVYVYYTATTPAAHNRIVRLVASGDVSTGVETLLVRLPDLSGATNHNGGGLHFGPDGKLYAAVGENANPARAQDPADPFGKILRFEPDGAIPPDNPFCATPGALRCAVWAMGLRNPFTFAFQPGTGRMHINDVGANTWEEVNLGQAGANYGWPGIEGPGSGPGLAAPLFAYAHPGPAADPAGPGGFFTGSVISGGAFYPASGPFPAHVRGSYFFAEFGSRWIARMDLANDGAVSVFANTPDTPVDLLAGRDGALYVLGYAGGTIARVTSP